jgi:transposase
VSKGLRYRLSEAEKDALLADQAALIDAQAARIQELEAALKGSGGGPAGGSGGTAKKTPRNSHLPPSAGQKADKPTKPRKPRPSRPGTTRRLAEEPDRTLQCRAEACTKCGTDVSDASQGLRCRYDHVEIPPILPCVTRVELFGGRCPCCGGRYRAPAPEGMAPGTPFGSNIHALLLYLHHSHHVGFERLSRLMAELFGVSISEGAISNAFARVAPSLETARRAIKEKLRAAEIIASDETTTRIGGVTHWQWVFVAGDVVLHEVAPRRAKAVAEAVLAGHRPQVWISDRYAGQQDLAGAHQVCLAHVLRDVQYAIDCGDGVTAPRIAERLAWAIDVGRRRDRLADSTLAQYKARVERQLDALLGYPAAHPAGRALQAKLKPWRGKLFVFLEDRRVPATNNASEQEIRPSVVFRKVTNGFRSDWGAGVHASYRSLVSTARRRAHTAIETVRALITGQPLAGMHALMPPR